MPSDTLFIFDLVREVQEFHAVIVQAIRFSQIYNIDLNRFALFGITYSEEKPLCVAICINVVLEN